MALTKTPQCRASRLAAMLALASLTACGAAAEDPIFGVARGLVQGVFNREPAAPAIDPRQVLTRDIINQAGLPLILVESPNMSTSVTMVRTAVNGVNETWQGEGDASIALSREGVLRATRSLGADLFSADIEGTRAVLASGGSGRAGRLYVHVVDDIEARQLGYNCDIARGAAERVVIFSQARSLTRVTETCSRNPTGETFENRYWIDGSGFAWASEQWAGPELGHLRIERLHR